MEKTGKTISAPEYIEKEEIKGRGKVGHDITPVRLSLQKVVVLPNKRCCGSTFCSFSQ